MITFTDAELQERFGHYREAAILQPVAVTHHGRDSVVLLSVEEYQRLKALDTRAAVYPWELPGDLAKALDDVVIPPEATKFNHDLG